MSWAWAGAIVGGWIGLGIALAPLVGRWLRRNSGHYPKPPPEPPVTAERPEDWAWPGGRPPQRPCDIVEPVPDTEASGGNGVHRPSTF